MNISVQDLKNKLENKEELTLIDVREPYEHEEFNIGGTLIPLGEIPSRIPDLDLDVNDQIVVYCRSGNRSMMAQHLLKEAGFEAVLNLEGGMLAWQEAENG